MDDVFQKPMNVNLLKLLISNAMKKKSRSSDYYKRASNRKKRILIVENNTMAVKIFALNVKASNLDIQFDHVDDGNEAVKLAMKNHYDGIYMNIGLPTISGIEACKLIRKYERKNNLKPMPIIAVTASGDRNACLEAGMQEFMRNFTGKADILKFLSYCEKHALNN